jgi:hypothetical protein
VGFLRHLRLLFLTLLVLPAALLGCGRDVLPPLLTVESLGPVQVEVGEKVEIAGTGFPAGRTAHITLRGTIARPGEELERHVDVRARGNAVSPNKVELEVDEDLASMLAGHARHATFMGEVEVAFAAVSGPPVYGVLAEATMDVRNIRVDEDDKAKADGLTFLNVHGMHVESDTAGIRIVEVESDSAAAHAGLGAGDRLVAYDGLRVLEVSDFAGGATSPAVALAVRRGATGKEELAHLSLHHDALRPSRLVVWGVAALGLFAVIVSLLLSHYSPALLSMARVVRARSRRALVKLNTRETVVIGAVLTLFAIVPLVRYWLVRDLDCLLLATVLSAVHIWILVQGSSGWRGGLIAFLAALPLVVLATGLVFVLGSLRLEDMLRLQGALPWQWAVLRDPARIAVFALFAYLSVQRTTARADGLAHALRLALTSGFLTLAFLGGSRIPAFMDSLRTANWGLFAGSVVFTAKAAALLFGLRWLSGLCAPQSPHDAFARARHLLPSGALLLVGLMWLDAQRPGDLVMHALQLVTLSLVLLFAVRLASAVRVVGRLPVV